MARILSVDFGEKRCGIAVTDELQIAVHPLNVVSKEQLSTFLKEYIQTENVIKIVFGKPTHRDGNPTHLWDKILEFSNTLKNTFPTLEIDYQDESYSSSEAKSIMLQSGMKKKQRQKKENVDQISAIIILQRYLNHI